MKLPTLYKNKNGKTQLWEISCELSVPCYIVRHGYQGGSIQETHTVVLEGKNKGRSNETTAKEQCISEAKALWERQRDRKGYSEDIRAVPALKPMLAKSYDDFKDRIEFPVYIQKKLDGICCLGYPDGRLISRQLKEFDGLEHIKDEISSLALDFILHGELFNKNINFREIISGVKKEGGNKFSKYIEYHVYDIAVENMSYNERLKLINSIKNTNFIKIVDTYVAINHSDIDIYHDRFKSEGYEGAMIRTRSGLYTPDKRSSDLLKVKKFLEKEYIIVGANENKGRSIGTCTFECQTLNGKRFNVMPEGSNLERALYWEKWKNGKIKVGDIATIKYFEYTDDINMIPRFPVLKIIRNYE